MNDRLARPHRPELLPLLTEPDVMWGERRLATAFVDRSERGLRTVLCRPDRPAPPFPGESGFRRNLAEFVASMARDRNPQPPDGDRINH